MRRCILISTRQNKDEKTGDELLFLTLSRLPNKMNNGGLWYRSFLSAHLSIVYSALQPQAQLVCPVTHWGTLSASKHDVTLTVQLQPGEQYKLGFEESRNSILSFRFVALRGVALIFLSVARF